MRAAIALSLVLASTVAPRTAGAQTLRQTREEPAPFPLSSRAIGPIGEAGGLVFFGTDIGTRADRAVRVEAAGTRAEPGADMAAITFCGGVRWHLGFEPLGTRGSWYLLRDRGGPALWSRSFPTTALPDVRLACAAGRATIGWLEDGELVLVDAAPAASAVAERGRIRVMPRGTIAQVPWALGPGGQLVAQGPARGGSPAELLRIALGPNGAAITHRQPLAGAPGPIAIAGTEVLVALDGPRGTGLVLAAYAITDLAPRGTAVIPVAAPGHSAACAGLWPGPSGRVAVAVDEHWIGDDFVAIPQGPDEPDRYEPAHESAGALYLWEPARARVGPATPLGTRWVGAGGWLAGELVVVQSVEAAGVVAGVVQLRGARVRRFTPVP